MLRVQTGVRWAVVLGLGLSVVACADEDEATRDSPVDVELQDNQAPYVVNMPNMFMGLALKCLGRDLVIAHTRPAAPAVLKDASLCPRSEGVYPPVVGPIEPK